MKFFAHTRGVDDHGDCAFFKKILRLRPLTMPLMMKKEMLLWFLNMVVM